MNLAALALSALLATHGGVGRPVDAGRLVTVAQPESRANEHPTTLGGVFRALPGDFRRLAMPDSLLILGVGGGAALAVSPKDDDIARSISSEPSPLEEALDPGSVIGDGYVQVGAALGTLVIGRIAAKKKVAALGADLLGAQLVNGVITVGLKAAVHRERPDGGNHSFPSGHSSATFATASVLQRRFGWKVGFPAYAVGGYVAAARMKEGEHFLSDVIFGSAIGIVAGRAATPGGLLRQWTASVVPLRGGFVVMFLRRPAR
jgi:membrane-associated phospholipid phosphatase